MNKIKQEKIVFLDEIDENLNPIKENIEKNKKVFEEMKTLKEVISKAKLVGE